MKNYLVIKAKGGMGNRMLCAVTGLLYADITGRIPYVDWSDGAYSNNGVNAFLCFFKQPELWSFPPDIGKKTIAPMIWQNNLEQSVSNMIHRFDPEKHSSVLIHRKYSIDPSRFDYSEDIIVYWSYTERVKSLIKRLRITNPDMLNKSKQDIIKSKLDRVLQLQDCIYEEKEAFKRAMWSKHMIGVHIRYTDIKIDLKKYEAPLRKMLGIYPDASIFLATDNIQVVDYMNRHYSNVIISDKWYPDDSGVMHQNELCPDKTRNGIEALLDMYLLADCDVLIYPGNSTFSWISSLLSKAQPKNKIDVMARNIKVRIKKMIRENI